MVEAAFKAFARALREAVEYDERVRACPPRRAFSDDTARLAILDYGMGNLRSVAKALEHVGAEPELTNDHARVREAGRRRAARRGRHAEGDGAGARACGSTSCCASASRPACR